jgi:predicted peptidase
MLRCLSLLLFGCSIAMSAEPTVGFLDKTHKNEDGTESKYVVFVPHGYDGTKDTPVILFLHGAGETKGTPGGKMPVEQGIAPHIKRDEKKFPAIVVIPQAESGKTNVGGRWHSENPDGKRAMAMLATTMKDYKCDEKRVILTGLSMGGFGTWNLAAAYPEKWSCIAPICGGGDVKNAEKIKDIPCWCWHGGADNVVKPELSRTMIEALKKAGGDPKYTELEHVGHNSWDSAYATPEYLGWMLKQKKK